MKKCNVYGCDITGDPCNGKNTECLDYVYQQCTRPTHPTLASDEGQREMTDFKAGDHVRAELGNNIIEGVARSVYADKSLYIIIDGALDGSWVLIGPQWTITRITPPISEDIGTIVRDTSGYPWLRCPTHWASTYENRTYCDALSLDNAHGPLIQLWPAVPNV